ncbi:MAG: hypothetical protein JSS49_13380 [Planctomycetes bacterium]|nr:hypothetical protein [Planctomycetota bacterium]
MIQIWQADPPGTQPAIKLASSSDRVVALDSSRQALLVYDGRKYTLKRWDIANQQLLPPLGPSNPQFWNIKCAAIGPDSRFLALVHQSLSTRSQMEQSHEFSILDLEQKSPVKKAGIQRDSIYNNYHSMVYLPGVNMFALGRTRIADGAPNSGTAMMATVELWLPDFSKRIEELVIGKYEGSTQLSEAQTVRVYLDVAPNARRLAAGCERGDLVVWDIGSWTELTKLRVKPRTYDRASPVRYVPKVPRPLLGVSISPDGSHVASTEAFSDSVTVWNISDGTSRSAWKSDPIPSLIFDGYGPVRENTDEAEIIMADYSPDGKRIATADAGGVIRIWNLSDEE